MEDNGSVMVDNEARAAQIREAMLADGVNPDDSVQEDYFGFEELHQVFLPDGKSWVQHQVLNEGARSKYLALQNRDVTVEKTTQNMKFRMEAGAERKALLSTAIVNWNLARGGQPVPFGKKALEEFLEKAPPKVVDLIEKDIRKNNPWLMSEMTVEDIDKQIEELQEMREIRAKEEEGKGG